MARQKMAVEDRSRRVLLQSQTVRLLPTLYNNTFSTLKKSGKNAEAMYSACGLSAKQGANIWSGKVRVDLSMVIGFADFLGVDPHELLTPVKEKK
jgi:hypothetical protein